MVFSRWIKSVGVRLFIFNFAVRRDFVLKSKCVMLFIVVSEIAFLVFDYDLFLGCGRDSFSLEELLANNKTMKRHMKV